MTNTFNTTFKVIKISLKIIFFPFVIMEWLSNVNKRVKAKNAPVLAALKAERLENAKEKAIYNAAKPNIIWSIIKFVFFAWLFLNFGWLILLVL